MSRVLLNCLDVVGSSMAGPAIRYWELAKVLSKKHDVTLFIPNKTDFKSDKFKIVSRATTSIKELLQNTDVLISQQISPKLALEIKKNKVNTILDAYDPEPLEHLEIFKYHTKKFRNTINRCHLNNFVFSFKMADRVICANTKQKDLWLGLLLGLKKITPEIYDRDSSLNNYVGIVPFGLSKENPIKKSLSLRETFKLDKNDFVLVWGGGIYNWFDPLTLIQAIKETQRRNIKLVFIGTRHPNPNVPEMKMTKDAIELARKLDLIDKQVFFNYSWLPYEERGGYLLEANVGVSTHFEHLETQFAFRTRILDYLWAELPILTTKGDSFADMVEKNNLGIAVDYQNPKELADGIIRLIDNPALIKSMKENIAKIRKQFFWEEVAKPIEAMIEQLKKEPKSFSILDQIKLYLQLCKVQDFQPLVFHYLPRVHVIHFLIRIKCFLHKHAAILYHATKRTIRRYIWPKRKSTSC